MDVAAPRQVIGRNLGQRADHHELPFRARRGHRREQAEIEPLVDHAEIADAWPRHVLLRLRFGCRHARRAV
jgi:hypothetical protein